MTPAAPSTAAAPGHGGVRRRVLAGLGLVAMLGSAACGADGGNGPAEPSPSQAEVTAEASATPTAASPTPQGGEASQPSDGGEAARPSGGMEASVPGNYRGTDSSTLAPGEAQRVLPGMRAAVVPAADMPGSVVTAERIQEMPDVPFSQPLPLEGVEPAGECRDLVRRIDAATVPHTVLLHTGYEVDPGSPRVLGPEATVGSFLVYTPSTQDLVGPYGALPEACGTLTGEDGTEVEFSAVDGVPGAVLVRSSGPRGESAVTLGGVSAGHRHLTTTFVQVDPQTAAEMLRAQVEAFRAAE